MAFTVSDFEDFLELLGQHPEWQARLRRMLLDEELAALRAEMADSHRRLEEAIAALSAEVRSFAERTEQRLGRLEADVGVLKGDVSRLKDDVGTLKGRDREGWYRERVTGVFGRLVRRARVVSFGELDEVDAAMDSGVLTRSDWDQLTLLDLLVVGTLPGGDRQFIAVEVTSVADQDDVERADRRAEILRRAGLDCIPAVGAEQISPQLLEFARGRGVGIVREGVVVYWPGQAA